MTTTMLIPIIMVCTVILIVPVMGLDYHLRRVWHFQKQRLKEKFRHDTSSLMALGSGKKLQVPLADVRDLVISLQLGTSMQSTLTGSLDKAAEQFAGRGVLGERLRRHVDARLSISPEAVLEGLAQDLDCRQLDEVLERIRMASEGGITYNRVLAVSVASIEEDMRSAIEQEIQRAPTRLTLPMVIGVFFPAILLGLLPLMASAVNQMR
jgi:tight adherence protein C